MRLRYILLAVASTLALACAVAPSAAQASAQSDAIAQARAPAASPASVPMTVCAQSGSGYCLNRSQCGTGNGTSVLVWAKALLR